MKDLNPFKTILKSQGAGSILRMGFALSKYPHFNSTYLVWVGLLLNLAVFVCIKIKASLKKKNQDKIFLVTISISSKATSNNGGYALEISSCWPTSL